MEEQKDVAYGVSINPGIAVGPVFLPQNIDATIFTSFTLDESQVESEVHRFESAINESKKEISSLKDFHSHSAQKTELGILSSHLLLLDDPLLTDDVIKQIRTKKENSAHIFKKLVVGLKERFSQMDTYFQDRVDDVIDVSARVLKHLGNKKKNPSFFAEGTICVKKMLFPSDVITAESKQILGFITKEGGRNSHAAILAKSKGIPYITGIDPLIFQKKKPKSIILDATNGKIFFDPGPELLSNYTQQYKSETLVKQNLERQRYIEAETKDGYCVSLMGSLDTLEDLDTLANSSIKGIGLYRSEHLYYQFQRMPTEEEQYSVYSGLLQKMQTKEVIIRAFDLERTQLLGPDMHTQPSGLRAIQALLNVEKVFVRQIRALLRAGVKGKLKLLLPMVLDEEEILQTRKLIEEQILQLQKEKIPTMSHIEVGAMIETPAAIFISDSLANQADFLSIGSNDLMHSTLGADRETSCLKEFSSTIHPSILRLLRMIVFQANKHNKKVILCGELAADTSLMPILLGIGIQNFTVSSRNIPAVVASIRKLSIVDAYEITEKAITCASAKKLSEFLK